MQFIYIIGAQCTGRTTLSEALVDWLMINHPGLRCALLSGTARTTLRLHRYSREDIRAGGDRCLELQELIMDSQMQRENAAEQKAIDMMISDRSAIDPLVYARMYCFEQAVSSMLTGDTWDHAKSKLQRSVVILCEPVQKWLFDDGTRLLPLDWSEWMATHKSLCTLLDQQAIDYVVVTSTVQQIQDRVDFVLSLCELKEVAVIHNKQAGG